MIALLRAPVCPQHLPNLLEAPSRQSSETRGRIRNASAESRLTRLDFLLPLLVLQIEFYNVLYILLGFSRISWPVWPARTLDVPSEPLWLGQKSCWEVRFTLCPVGSTRHSVLDPNLFDDSKLKVGLSFGNKLCKAVMEILGSVPICQGSVAVLKSICQRCFPSNSSECCSCVYLSIVGALQQVNWGLLRQ